MPAAFKGMLPNARYECNPPSVTDFLPFAEQEVTFLVGAVFILQAMDLGFVL